MRSLVVFYLSALFLSSTIHAGDNVVNIYSFRKAELIAPLLTEFTKQTGIKANVVSGKADKLIKRLVDDGDNSFADVLLTVDVARLEKAKQLRLIQPIKSKILQHNVPPALRDPEHYWLGVSLRARAIFYAKDRVDASQLTSYQSLVDKKWHGKICSRKGSHFYNQSMVASFIHRYGKQWSEGWVSTFIDNLAERPNGGDRDQLRKIARGVCDVAIANSYYYGMLSASVKQSDRDVYRQIGIVLPSNNGVGAHVNISGAAVTRAAKNKANAIRFVEFLTTEKAQKIYADINYEYPVRHNTLAAELLTSWGVLNADLDSILQLTKYHEESKAIISKYRW